MPSRLSLLASLLSVVSTVALVGCGSGGDDVLSGFEFAAPASGLVTEPGMVTVDIRLPKYAVGSDLVVELDGEPIDLTDWTRTVDRVTGTLDATETGEYRLSASVPADISSVGIQSTLTADTWFETATFDRPEECEVLNAVECALPYPSSFFLSPADTATGFRVDLPTDLPLMFNLLTGVTSPYDPATLAELDGFSPTAQMLMHFTSEVDLVSSGAAVLQEGLETFDTRSLDDDHPTVLVDAETGEKIAHFLENDARADPASGRVITFLRPAQSLIPGRRYLVAARDLVDPQGLTIEPEMAFVVYRDRRPTDIPGLEARRVEMDDILDRLSGFGVPRGNLILAFDFVVQSDESLTGQMLTMRDDAFAWLDSVDGGRFTVDEVEVFNPDCADPDQNVWKQVRGTYEVPLYLDRDPFTDRVSLSFLTTDEDGNPITTLDDDGEVVTTRPPFTIGIPCTALLDGPVTSVVLGHGLFGTGQGLVDVALEPSFQDFELIGGGTDWIGMSSGDLGNLFIDGYLFRLFADLNQFAAHPDRMRQGVLNALVLGRMMSEGVFNSDCEFRADPDCAEGTGVFAPGDHAYIGSSLGGIMGIIYSALAVDATRMTIDIGGINFSILLQRSTNFIDFQPFVDLVNTDAMSQSMVFAFVHELWVRSEGAGYVTHVTSDPLPGTPAKQILMTSALYDPQVANISSHMAAVSMGLPNLDGSIWSAPALMSNASGVVDSAFVMYDTGYFDAGFVGPSGETHAAFIPPLANLEAEPNRCDPHPVRIFIPASVDQLLQFVTEGTIQNFCEGACDGAIPDEQPNGEPCDPFG